MKTKKKNLKSSDTFSLDNLIRNGRCRIEKKVGSTAHNHINGTAWLNRFPSSLSSLSLLVINHKYFKSEIHTIAIFHLKKKNY